MKTCIPWQHLRLLNRGAFLLFLLAIIPEVEAAKYCYPINDYDKDRDGYADLTGIDPRDDRFLVDSSDEDGGCPADTVSKYGDCKDLVESIHPGRGEIGYNWIDDNCNNDSATDEPGMDEPGVDEPVFYYYRQGYMNTATSFRIMVYLNHSHIQKAAKDGSLYAKIAFAPLRDSANLISLPQVHVTSFGDSYAYCTLALSGLSPATAYRVRVSFYKKDKATGAYPPVGPSTEWYYTMTDGNTAESRVRALMVLKGLKEYSDSNQEIVGYRGRFPDGTRYGAEEGQQWCSEFYAWVTNDWLRGLEEVGVHYWGQLVDYFQGYRAWWPDSFIPILAAPGDYLAVDNLSGDNRSIDHSAMFLAYDPSQTPPQIWTLEKSSNKVKVRDVGILKMRGLGHIVAAQLE